MAESQQTPSPEAPTTRDKFTAWLDILGVRRMSDTLGFKDLEIVRKVAESEGTLPIILSQQVEMLDDARQRVAKAYGESTAVFFMTQPNPHAGYRVPLEYIATAAQNPIEAQHALDDALNSFLAVQAKT